jgi:hypothetical protein
MGQGRGRRPRARRAAPRGRGLGRVALPSFGGPGVLPPENFSNLSSKSVHFNAYLRSYVVSRSVFFPFFLHKTRAKTRPNDRHENAQIYRLIALTLCTYMLQYSV